MIQGEYLVIHEGLNQLYSLIRPKNSGLIPEQNSAKILSHSQKTIQQDSTIRTHENLPANSVVVNINLPQTPHHLKLVISPISFNLFVVISHLRTFKSHQSETSYNILTKSNELKRFINLQGKENNW